MTPDRSLDKNISFGHKKISIPLPRNGDNFENHLAVHYSIGSSPSLWHLS